MQRRLSKMNRSFVKCIIIFLFITTNIIWLAVGLWPYTFHLQNHVSLDNNKHCLTFDHLSQAFIQSSFLNEKSTFTNKDSFSLELMIKPAYFTSSHVSRIISICDGKDEVFFIGQWKRGLVVRYVNCSKKILETGKDNVLTKKTPFFITFVKFNDTIQLFVNGKLVANKAVLFPDTANNFKKKLFVIGNSSKGNQQWNGGLYALAAFNKKLTQQKIEKHYKLWEKDRSYSQLRDESVFFYSFDSKFQRIYKNGSLNSDSSELIIPNHLLQLQKDFLVPPWIDFRWEKDYAIDVIQNLLAFIILGVLATASFSYLNLNRNILISISTLNSLLISITIETLQIYLPTRSSQLSDLILNTAGGFLGALIFLYFTPRIRTLVQNVLRNRKEYWQEP
jgi:hypothetical protein